ncbi:MAG TPA: L,D-transpeptidase [Bryobacteraceae bacterium]|nr:L,D-transpeptidase [Bryobacteraceae bacterium]
MRQALFLLAVSACLPAAAGTGPECSFRVEVLTSANRNAMKRYRAEQIALLEKLNRADARHLARLKVLVAPSRWDLDELAYSPLPATYDWARSREKVLVVDLTSQVFGAYENGTLVRWGPVSTGRKGDSTPAGVFHLNWWTKGRYSTVDPTWYMPWYFNFLDREGLAFHAYTLPGYPDSHACVRMLERDAKWLCGWGRGTSCDESGDVARRGTTVVITGQYEYGAPPPWRSAKWWTHSIELPSDPQEESGQAKECGDCVTGQCPNDGGGIFPEGVGATTFR